MTHDEARDAISLFVVGADDPAAREALSEHVSACVECRQMLQDYALTTDALARAVPQIRPRSALRTKTLDTILKGGPSVEMRAREAAAAPSTTRPWSSWLAAAAALLAVASLAGLFRTRAELASVRAALQTSLLRVAEAERNTSSARSALVTYRQVFDVVMSDDQVQVVLAGQSPAPQAGAKAFLSRTHNTLIFTARDLPALPSGRVYQLWAIAGGTPVSAGLLDVDANGHSQMISTFPTLSAPLMAMAVTVEPLGGVPSPTGPKYLIGAYAPQR